MKDQINTIREFVESQRHVGRTKALTALAQIEAAVGEPVAWCPALTYPGHEKDRVWANGKPSKEDIKYWAINRKGITYAYAAPVAQHHETVTDDEQARADLEAEVTRLREALTTLQMQCNSLAASNWREWQELASPQEFERWAKSRAVHMEALARAALKDTK